MRDDYGVPAWVPMLCLSCWQRGSVGVVPSVARPEDHPRRAVLASWVSLWAHVSLSHYRDKGLLPGWYDLRDLHWLLYPGDFGVQVVAPPSRHRSIAEVAHVFTRLDAPAVPDFGRFGGV